MVTIDDKLKLFSKIVFDKIDEEIRADLEVFEKEKEEVLKKEKEKIDTEKKKSINIITKRSEIKGREIVSKAKIQSQKEILGLKENMINDLLEELKDKFKEYSQTEEYKSYLYKEIDSAVKKYDEKEFTIYLAKNDYEKYKDELMKNILNNSVQIKESKDDIIGGFILQDKDMKFRVDNTLLNNIYHSKEKVGIMVMEALK
ncbi:V-type ATP synthase subunit E [Clostridium lundense]|uniref:V-type ATP synthase subunit E n=1 Tax=Clostridium lundense TaxID=319475 RepID=UPI0004821895|nr:V-type ATP synthase subunit E [Clostridium lundense]